MLFCEALEEAAPEILCNTSTNCRNALAKLHNKETDTPDLIFLDINIPVMSGWQCLCGLKEQDGYKHIPVIMYSTTSHAEDVDKAQQLGALCFFYKTQQL
jgi:CheY-like chemotaxis protein